MLQRFLLKVVVVLTVGLCLVHGQEITRRRNATAGDVVERHPYSVSLRSLEDHVCSGVLVGNYTVVTASQCVDSRFGRNGRPSLWLASGNNEIPSQNTVFRETVDSIRHPNFSLSDTSRYDIAVLTMNESVWPLRNIRTLSFLYDTTVLIGGAVSYVGYGRTSGGSSFAADLRIGEAEVLSPDRCLSVDINFQPDVMLCLSDAVACRADKGGPVFLDRTNAFEDILVGISSGTECFAEYELGGVANVLAPDIQSWLNETIFRIETARNAETDNVESMDNTAFEEAVESQLSIEELLDLLEVGQEMM